MKVIDLLNKIANREEVPHFIIDEQEYYLGADGFLKELYGDEVEWALDAEWLNTEAEIIEEEKEIEEMIKLNNVSNSSDLIALSQMQWENNCHIERKINELVKEVNELKKKAEDERS